MTIDSDSDANRSSKCYLDAYQIAGAWSRGNIPTSSGVLCGFIMDERGKVVEDKENHLNSAHRTHRDVFLNVAFVYTNTAPQGLAERISQHVARSLDGGKSCGRTTLHEEPSTPTKTIEQKVANRRLCQIPINVLSHLHSTTYWTPPNCASLCT